MHDGGRHALHVLRHYLPIARLRLWRSAGSRLVHNLTNSSNDLENPFFSGSGSLGSGLVGQATQHHVSASTCLARGVGATGTCMEAPPWGLYDPRGVQQLRQHRHGTCRRNNAAATAHSHGAQAARGRLLGSDLI